MYLLLLSFSFLIDLGMHKPGFVYIITNKLRTTLYVGVTSDLLARLWQHKEHFYRGSFSDRYNLTACVYYEAFDSIEEAISREKTIKKWRREKKDELINSVNPYWKDLWYELQKQ